MASANQKYAAWVKRQKKFHMDLVKETIRKVNEEIVKETPVKTGTLSKSYYAGINSVPSGPPGAGDYLGVEVNLKPGDKYYFLNTAPYAWRQERGFVGMDSLGRYYNQSGKFFMARALSRVRAIAQETVARLRS